MSYAKWTQQVALLYYTFEVSKDSALPVIPVLPQKIIRQRKWFISLIALLISSYHSNRNGVKALGLTSIHTSIHTSIQNKWSYRSNLDKHNSSND